MMALYEDLPLTTMKLDMVIDLFGSSQKETANSMLSSLQFDNQAVRDLCDQLGINKNFSALYHPQSNGQAEAVNKIIKMTLKRRLDTLKG